MKTVEEFIIECNQSAALQDELNAVKSDEELNGLLKKHDCGFTVNEYIAALKADNEPDGKISDDESEAAAGGTGFASVPKTYSSVKKDNNYWKTRF